MASNEFALGIDIPQLTLMIEALQKVANRIFSGLVLAGLLVASAMLLPYHRSLGTGGFMLAGVLALIGAVVSFTMTRHTLGEEAPVAVDVARATG